MSSFPRADTFEYVEGNTKGIDKARSTLDAAESKAWSMGGNSKHENREIPPAGRKKSPTAVRKLLRRYSGHERRWEVRWARSTCETDEQRCR
jgi:hypothetical protein